MKSIAAAALLVTAAVAVPTLSTRAANALNPSCHPGGNFDLSPWSLQLPIKSGDGILTIKNTDLEGCDGYSNGQYFSTESHDGSMIMKAPGSSCDAKTAHSQHCRTEFREVNPSSGSAASWSPANKNRLRATLAVITPGDKSVVIGQIHIDDKISTKPAAELYYSPNGDIALGVPQDQNGGPQDKTPLGNVQPGTQFSYEIRWDNNQLQARINNNALKNISQRGLNSPRSYFKAGNYNQGDANTSVHFFALTVEH